ncbi:sugar ABC transporter ATP-binding protein [Candidatus Sumerlaeota bacterium]|nr:sugar ABC transporter ATP-binding protein [Candidatus Sumerlaeota bacterium]
MSDQQVRNEVETNSGGGAAPAPLLEMQGICKRFPGVIALDRVDFSIGAQEVLGLIGENGAGKSTLMNILGGIYQPDGGEIRMDGRVVHVPDVTASMKLGVAFIHQELNVLDNIDVAGNVFLGREPRRGGPLLLIDRKRIHENTRPYLKRLGLDISSKTLLKDLPIAQRQMVEIAKALSLDARLIIMDEPTSSLTLHETEQLLKVVLELKHQGVSVIYISHRLAELNDIADRVVGLRDGKNAGELTKDEISHDAMVRMMVGRDIKSFYVESHAEVTQAHLRVRGIRSRSYPQYQVSFDASRGEIFGFAGLVGAGRSEVMEAIFGIDRQPAAQIYMGEEQLKIRSVRDAIRHGIYLVPEDRRGSGLITRMAIRENIPLPAQGRYAKMGCLISRRLETKTSEEQRESLDIKTPSVETEVVNLSGGNQQKVVLGKWLSLEPHVIIFDEPTRGIDVGAKAEIYRIMRDLAKAGVVVIMISSDMEEILHVSDRVAVMCEGRITGVLTREHCSEENIMQLAVGNQVEGALPPFKQDKGEAA